MTSLGSARTSLVSSSLSLLALLMAGGCGEEPVSADDCIQARLDQQPTQRFPAGRTYYLPTLGDGGACGDLEWRLSSAPEGNDNAVVDGDDGVPRFTPVVPGDYVFALAGTSETRTLTALDPATLPFHNLNYFGAHSAAQVGAELWVADVYAPRLTRLDPDTLASKGSIVTGGWPVAVGWHEGMRDALVVQRADDTVGFVDVEKGHLVDAVWVGDEPSNLVVSPDGTRAYVALQHEAAIAVIDVAARAVVSRIETVADPRAMAVSPDGRTLAVASHRSGQPVRLGFQADPVAEERDLALIDTESGSVRREVIDLGSTLTGLLFSADGRRLYVATQRNDTEISQVDPAGLSFQNLIVALDPATGEVQATVDLAKQEGSGGFAAFPHQLALAGGSLWVAVEASDLLLELDPDTLAERRRVAAPGRPRALVATDDAVWVHGAQGFSVTRVAGDRVETAVVGEDPRPALVAAGMAQFTGAGEELFADRACNSCHTDGLGDTLVWQAGPFPAYFASRAQMWLEGTRRLGWDAYLSNTFNFAFGVSTNVGRRLDTAQAQALAAYLDSIMAPPPANAWTERDGALSEQGERGRALYEGKAACAGCHPLPLTTNQQLLEEGITPGPADVPALVGAYRHRVWLKHGEARTLRDSVVQVDRSRSTGLTAEEIDDVTRFLQELTDRHFFVLASDPPADGARVAPEAPLRLTFNVPVWDDPKNLEQVWLQDDAGTPVAATVSVEGRVVTLEPTAALEPDARYEVVVGEGLQSLDERTIFGAQTRPFTTALAPTLRLEGEYAWTVQFPAIDIAAGGFDFDTLIPTTALVTATPTPSGARLQLDYGGGFVLETSAIIEGSTLHLPNLVIAVGGSGVDSTTMEADLVDDDGDGVADGAEGLVGFSGPGMLGEDLTWVLDRPSTGCEPGASGDVAVTVTRDDSGRAVIDWGEDTGLAFFVTDPGAVLPAGPGSPVTGGAVYWGLQLAAFPTGFAAPVTYGEVPPDAVDVTGDVGGEGPGAVPLVPGQCYKFAVTTTAFASGQVVLVWE